MVLAGLALFVGAAAPAAAQSPPTPSPDPAPAAAQQHTAPKPTPSSTGSTHSSPAPQSAPAVTPAPVVSSPPPAPVQSSPPPAPSAAPAAAPRHSVVKAKATAKAKTTAKAKAKARHVAPAKPKPKPAVHAKKPVVHRPVAPAASANPISLPADVPGGDSGSGLSNRSVLLIAFLVAVGAGLLALLVGAGWRRLWWWRRYHSYPTGGPPTEVRPQPVRATLNGSNGAAADGAEPVTVATGRGADAPTGT